MKVVLMGSGNVATVLGKKFLEVGYEVIQVVGRSKENSMHTANILNSSYTTNLLDISLSADIYVIAVSDNIVQDISNRIHLNHKLIVHTAGSVSKEVLKNSSENYGVMYPLQSLRKEMDRLPDIPILVDGCSEEVIERIREFSKLWASSIYNCTDEYRLKLHVAAVVSSNFTNHLYTLSEQYCKEYNLNFSALLPLIKETIERLAEDSASNFQTGPAIRGDFDTIQKHQQYLQKFPELQSIYQLMTDSIRNFHKLNITSN